MYSLPYQDILKGMLGSFGIDYELTEPPVGTLVVQDHNGEAIDTSDIAAWGFGPHDQHLQRPDQYFPLVHIEPYNEMERRDGPKARLIHFTWRVYYVMPIDTTMEGIRNPFIMCATRTKALQNMLDYQWQYLESPIRVDMDVDVPMVDNEWQTWNKTYNAKRIAYAFDVLFFLREIYPEVADP